MVGWLINVAQRIFNTKLSSRQRFFADKQKLGFCKISIFLTNLAQGEFSCNDAKERTFFLLQILTGDVQTRGGGIVLNIYGGWEMDVRIFISFHGALIYAGNQIINERYRKCCIEDKKIKI